ncbi:hypothetical protein [Promicromonospora sp. NPDC050249]|uniref:hypothetical protein n=1 Tax=Promicromonospora sp. NPDC050249 TaxID=3154743 RepID=UPI0033E46F53
MERDVERGAEKGIGAKGAWIGAGAVVLAALLAAAIGILPDIWSQSGSPEEGAPSSTRAVQGQDETSQPPSPTPTNSLGGDADPTFSPEPSGLGESPSKIPTEVSVRYLTDIEPIGGSYGNYADEEVVQMDDKVYSRSIVFTPSYFNSDTKSLDFKVPSGLTTFQADVMLSEDTAPAYTATVEITHSDGSIIDSVTIRYGEVQEVKLGLAGASYITITMSVLEQDSDAMNNRPDIVIGDGRFTK